MAAWPGPSKLISLLQVLAVDPLLTLDFVSWDLNNPFRNCGRNSSYPEWRRTSDGMKEARDELVLVVLDAPKENQWACGYDSDTAYRSKSFSSVVQCSSW